MDWSPWLSSRRGRPHLQLRNLLKHPFLLAVCLCTAVWTGCRSLPCKKEVSGLGSATGYEEASRMKSQVNLAKVNETWPGPPITRAKDAFRVTVQLGDRELVADTHLFGGLNVIPYSSEDEAVDALERPVGRGDAVLSTYFPPGDIGISVEHHRPEYRVLSFEQSSGEEMKEHFKLQDSHVGILVGVQRNGAPGVITLNNPQAFEDGRLGEAYSPRLYLRPVYPWYLSREQKRQFRDNIRTMAMGLNAVSQFPETYNGGDPLSARNPAEVREVVRQMIRAIGGDEAARAWFREESHLLYCSEFAFLSLSAGMIVPLNEASVTELAGAKWWKRFAAQVEAHNGGRKSAFTKLNENSHAGLVTLSLAPASLQPIASYAPREDLAASRLAFPPMTMADLIEAFLALHLPRSELGESLASDQATVFRRLQPGLLELMAMNELSASDPRRQAVDGLMERIALLLATPHENYAAFRKSLEPLLAEARAMTGPRDDSGTGLFVPPCLMHLVAKGRHPGGLLGMDYVGHGLHWSLMDRAGDVVAPTLAAQGSSTSSAR